MFHFAISRSAELDELATRATPTPSFFLNVGFSFLPITGGENEKIKGTIGKAYSTLVEALRLGSGTHFYQRCVWLSDLGPKVSIVITR